MVDAVVEVEVRADLTKLNSGLDQAKLATKSADKELNKLGKSTQSVTRTQAAYAAATTLAHKAQQSLVNTTRQAGAAVGQLRQSVAGAIPALTGLGGAAGIAAGGLARVGVSLGLGGVLTVGAVALSLGIAKLSSNFVELQNQIALTPALSANAAQHFDNLRKLSERTGIALSTLVEQSVSLNNANAHQTVSQEQLTRAFNRYYETIAANRQRTISDSFARIKDQIAETANNLDRALGITTMWAGVLERVNNAVKGLPFAGAQDDLTFVARRLQDVQTRNNELLTRLREAHEQGGPGGWITKLMFGTGAGAEDLKRSLAEETELLLRFQQLTAQARPTAPKPTPTRSPEQLLPELQSLRQSLMTGEQAEQESYARRLALLQEFKTAELLTQQQSNTLIAQENFRHAQAMTALAQANAQHIINAQTAAAQQGVELLSVIGNQSRAAAIASLVLNKGLAIAQVAINSAAAQVRALAELGPIAGPPAAAAIAGWSKVQMALIAATGIAQGLQSIRGAPTTGGTTGGTSGTGGQTVNATDTAQTQAEQPMVANVLEIHLKKHQRYTTDEVDELMDRISERTKLGKVFLATKLE